MVRPIPVEQTFSFTPETFVAQLKSALAPLAVRMGAASFYLRLERRGVALLPRALRERFPFVVAR